MPASVIGSTAPGRVDELETPRGRRSSLQCVARRLLAEFHLPDPDLRGAGCHLISESFLTSLLTATDETAMRELVSERSRLVRAAAAHAAGRTQGKPLSREQGLAESADLPATTAEAFARAIT